MDILRKHTPKKAVVHCFSGSAETAREIIDLGLHISFTGVLTFNNAKKALEALKEVPLERLMLETDCPYMAPVPYRGKRCDSSMIIEIAKKAALIKEVDVEQLLEITCKNAEEFFGIDK
jgi:TatD DNase family protein